MNIQNQQPQNSSLQTFGAAALSYGHVAKVYDVSRPDYPEEDIDTLIYQLGLNRSQSILDLGAGTGKLTKALLKRLYPRELAEKRAVENFYAIEVSADMRVEFTNQFPGVKIFPGFAEASRLVDNCLDVVVVGTAFHWFKGKEAVKEIHRVTTPNGKVLLIWNLIDREVKWVSALLKNLEPTAQANNHDTGNCKWLEAFEGNEYFTNPAEKHIRRTYTIPLSVDNLINSLLTFKAAGEMTSAQKQLFIEKARRTLSEYAETANKTIIHVPYRVEMYICHKKGITKTPSLPPTIFYKTVVSVQTTGSHANLNELEESDG